MIDQYLYSVGVVDTSLPFDDLRQRAHINDVAKAADQATDFSGRIRAGFQAQPSSAPQRQKPAAQRE